MATEWEVVEVYADGGNIHRNPSPEGGTWAWCWVNKEGERVRCGSGYYLARDYDPLKQITNNQMEFYAVCKALRQLPEGWSGTVCTDNLVTLRRLSEIGISMKGLPEEWVVASRPLIARLGRLTWRHLSGHPTKKELEEGISKEGRPVSVHNEWCHLACEAAAKQYLQGIMGK